MKKTNSPLLQILGWYGVAAVVLAYVLLNFSVLQPKSAWYLFLNLSGSFGIALEAYSKKDYQPFLLNCVWMLVAAAVIISSLV